jgi:hypothetical protein
VLLGANEYLLIFATGEEKGTEGGQLHTDFTIQKKGGSLALLKPRGEEDFEVVSEFVSYPRQKRMSALVMLREEKRRSPNTFWSLPLVSAIAVIF